MGSVKDIIKELLKQPPTECSMVTYNHFNEHLIILPDLWIFEEKEHEETYHLSFTFKKKDEIEKYINRYKDKPMYFELEYLDHEDHPKIEMSGYIIGLTKNRLYTTSVLYQPQKIDLIYPPVQLVVKSYAKKINFQIKIKKQEE